MSACCFKGKSTLRWSVNTNSWFPNRTEWITAMRLVGSDIERDRINRYVYKKDAKHALVGRLLIRKCCEHFLGPENFCFYPDDDCDDQQLMLDRSDKGKPILIKDSEDKIRLQIELEFVQCLANPNYLNFLAQRGYFNDKSFINYLSYLQYWKRPEYSKLIKYPMCLHFLDLLQHEHFRRELTSNQCAKFIDDQILLHWHHYARKRTKLFQQVQQQKQQQQQNNQSFKDTSSHQNQGNKPSSSGGTGGSSHQNYPSLTNGHVTPK